MKVIILGKGEMLANLIRGALLADVEIAGVFRYERLIYSPFRLFLHDFSHNYPENTLIRNHKLPEIKCKSANSEKFKNEVLKRNADIILVGTWREKLKKEIINLPKIGTINAHPSLLPKYRGPNPYLQAIWHGEKKSGITFHLMDENFDSGAILAQAEVEILSGDTSRELKNKTVFTARLLCAEMLKKLKFSVIEPISQDINLSSYYQNIKPEDMTLNFLAETAEGICRHVRAFHPFMPTYIQYKNSFYIANPYNLSISEKCGKPGEILQRDLSNNSLVIAASDGKGVEFRQLKKYRKFRFLR